MKLKLIARHLRDDQDYILHQSKDVNALLARMQSEIQENKSEGSNWRYSIVPHEDEYK